MNYAIGAPRIVWQSLVLTFLESNPNQVAFLSYCFRVVLMSGELSLKPTDEVFGQWLFALDVSKQTLDDAQMIVYEHLNLLGVALGYTPVVSDD